MPKEGFEELRDEGQKLLGTFINSCNAECSQITLMSYCAPAELHILLAQSSCRGGSALPACPGWGGCCPPAASGDGCRQAG